MPEGHTLHALARDLAAAFAGTAPTVTSPQGRFADGAALLDGREVLGAEAWGKHLLVAFAAEAHLHVHLGLIGTFRLHRIGPGSGPFPPRGAVRVRLESPTHLAELRGPITCRVLDPDEVRELAARQGPDPLRPGADPERAWGRIHGSRRPVAELLMDQAVLAGVGNVYRCEVLWRHRVAPLTPGSRLKRATWQALWGDLVRLMPLGVATGRIVTVEEQVLEVEADLATGRVPVLEERTSAVYRRTGEPCPRCGSRVRTAVVGGRNLYWCGRCQRRG